MAGTAAPRTVALRSSLWDGVQAARDRLVSSLAFQRTVSRLPGVRKIAQNQAKEVFDLVAGFVYSQTLLACVELGLLQQLLRRPMTINEMAAAASLPRDGMERLVAAAVSLKLLAPRSQERFGLGMRGAAIAGNAGLLKMIAHHAMFYRDLADPVALLRGEQPATELSRYWGYAAGDGKILSQDDTAPYSDLMSASQSLIADAVLDAYPFGRHVCMLDAGGGDGTFISRVAERHPKLEFVHFDLPAVSTLARARFERSGLVHRARTVPGSFFDDDLPKGADLVTLVRILHDHDTESVRKILRRARHALEPGGTLLIAEPLAGTHRAQSMGDAYFGFYLMAMGKGRPRTKDELARLMVEAGFDSVREAASAIPLQTRILTAKV